MQSVQSGILANETRHARYLTFSIASAKDIGPALHTLCAKTDPEQTVIGIGQSLVSAMNKTVSGLRVFQALVNEGVEIPSTPSALWCWLRGTDRGEIYHRSRQIEAMLSPAFVLDDVTDSFRFDENRDLSGYEDGTENPKGEEAIAAAIVQGQGDTMDGSSFVAVQQWLHDLERFDDMSTEEQDNAMGRHISNNEEFDEAPESAHVNRAAQESFDPEAFVLRRSMPWVEGLDGGLVFVAFGHSFDAYEAILNRMIGNEDGIRDALFKFTRPITGAYYWCPPVKDGRLNLSAIGV
jgi:putative iron-dependent peroxidase